MNPPLSFASLRDRWPNADASQFVEAAGLRWHVQRAGTGAPIVLLHGAGGATYTWRDVFPLLARNFDVTAMDFPGHGFTTRPDAAGLSLAGMTGEVRELLRVLNVTPQLIVGHSAGGAMALSLAAEFPSAAIVGVNAALAPPNVLLSFLTPTVEVASRSTLLSLVTAKLATSEFLFDALMQSTGSRIAPAQRELYRTFATSPTHVGAVLSMFAGWNLNALSEKLPDIQSLVTLIVGMRDGWVPPRDTQRMAMLLPNARIIELGGAGHLAHEECPERVCEIIQASLVRSQP